MITVTNDILKKLTLIDYDLNSYSLDTVKMFYSDAIDAGFKLVKLMKYSFILCTRNSERVIAEVLESIVRQNIDNKLIEVILSDYESSDKTSEIVKTILKKRNKTQSY